MAQIKVWTARAAVNTIAAAALSLGLAGAAHAQPWCMSYMPQGANGVLTLCPPAGDFDLHLTPEQRSYFELRAQALTNRIIRQGNECFGPANDNACNARVAREMPVPKPTPEALRFLARYGITEQMAQ